LKSLYISHNPQFSPLSEVLKLCEGWQCGIELAALADNAVLEDPLQIEKHRRQIPAAMSRSIHAPYLGFYPGHPDPLVRAGALACFRQVYRASLALEAEDLVFHHNYDPSACSPAEWLRNSVEFWKSFLEESPGRRVHLENVMDVTPDLLLRLIESVGSPLLDIALDVGHVNCYSGVPLSTWIGEAAGRIGYLHLHDNHGQEDEHLAIGEGGIDWPPVLHQIEVKAPAAIWTLEAGGSRMYRSLKWLQENWFRSRSGA